MSGTAVDAPGFTPNEVNIVNVGDRLRGAGAGSPFGGVGELNAGIQKVANRTAFLKGRQDTNIQNIKAIQAVLVPSSRSQDVFTAPGTLFPMNAGFAVISSGVFVFPPSSPTQLFTLHFQVAADLTVTNGPPELFVNNAISFQLDGIEGMIDFNGPITNLGQTFVSTVSGSGIVPAQFGPQGVAGFVLRASVANAIQPPYTVECLGARIRMTALPCG